MTTHLHKDLEKLKRDLLTLSAKVEESVRLAVQALESCDVQLSVQIRLADREIDTLEVEIEEECLKILALHQPVAIDLRFIVSVLKMNNDLERIGDLAVNISDRAAVLAGKPPVDLRIDIRPVAAKAQRMLRQSLDSVVNLDPVLARKVCKADDEVDLETAQIALQIKVGMQEKPQQIDQLIQYLLATRHIERIADLATNIAEDAIYMVDGEIVRHRGGSVSG
jgi:phosphate transport system protein